ncbi:hypothetical protein [Mycolicibacterium sp. J2]|uniref:hypothetical protein n=1 Tax=Mycolicibacterium sp. J2 TaxID=2993511 RepID=UPI00224A7C88|nr:hypothetical protein [Mycolicibacterium sp. J2]MCX2714518.1 hypothetical protein [Mycolicibacterium sp. J2]
MGVRDRILTGFAGGGLITPAVLALLHGIDGSAVLGFTVLGGIGLLIAAVGTLPARAVIGRGKNAITLHLATAIETVVEALPASELEPLASRLALEGSNDEPGSNFLVEEVNRQFFFERETMKIIKKVAHENGAVVKREVATGDDEDSRWDALVQRGSLSLAIDLTATIDVHTVRRIKNRYKGTDVNLLLIGSKISSKAEALLTTFPDGVAVLHSDDPAALESELRRIMENLD